MTDVMTKPHQLIASDRIEGTAVRRPNGDRISHIERLMIDKISGKVSYAIPQFRRVPRHGSQPASAAVGAPDLQPGESRPTSSISTMTSSGARRRSAPTRISTGAIGRRKRSCIAITE